MKIESIDYYFEKYSGKGKRGTWNLSIFVEKGQVSEGKQYTFC